MKKEENSKISPEQMLAKCRQSLVALRMKKSMGELNQTHLIGKMKRQIAYLLTKAKKSK